MQVLRPSEAALQGVQRRGEPGADGLQRLKLRFAAPLQRPEQRVGADAVLHDVVLQAVRLVGVDGHEAGAQQRRGVLGPGPRVAQPERRQQALRQGVPRRRAAGGQEDRHAVGAKRLPEGLVVALDVPAEDHEVVEAPAVFHRQPAAQRRGEPAFLQGIAGGGHLDAPGRGLPAARREGEQLPGQVPKLRGLPRGLVHSDARHRRAEVLAGAAQTVIAATEGEEHVEIGGGLVVLQRQEHPGVRAHRAHRRHQAVQRGRGQVEAEEADVAPTQEVRASGQRRGVTELRLAVLEAALQKRLVFGLDQSEVLELHGQQPLGFRRAGPQPVRGQPRLPDQLQLTGAAVREAPAVLRAAVQPEGLAARAHGGAHQHHAAPLVDPDAVRRARRFKDAPAQALRAVHL